MTRQELQTELKALREQGYEVKVKLNATNDALQAEYNRLQVKPVAVAPVVEVVEVAEVVELAPVVEVVELSSFEGIDYETMRHTNWATATPLTCDVNSFQYCELPPRKLTLTEIMARPLPEVTPEMQQELDQLEELFSPRNIADEIIQETKATDTYWLSWNAAYYRAVDVLATKKHQSELEQFQDKWNTMMNSKVAPTPKPVDFGVLVAFVLLECWQGLKSAAKFAKKTAIA